MTVSCGGGDASLRTFAGRWQGHGRGLTITRTGHATEIVNSGCCYLVIAVKFRLSHPRGTPHAARSRATVTSVRVANKRWFSKRHPPPRIGDTATIRVRDGRLYEGLTGVYYCLPATWRRQLCGA
jgi:hypothetical protein